MIDVRHSGDATLAALRVRAHGGGSATPIEEPLWHVCRYRDGRAL